MVIIILTNVFYQCNHEQQKTDFVHSSLKLAKLIYLSNNLKKYELPNIL